MSRVSVEDLLKAGAHFGHLTSRRNPKMSRYIFMERNGVHILDLTQTQNLLEDAANMATRIAKMGRPILFVGTKKQAQEIVKQEADRCGQPYVSDRWLGGMLTNFQTIRGSIKRMEGLQKMGEDGTMEKFKKKERLMKQRELEKLERTLTGISKMGKVPGAIFIIDPKREHIAVLEAQRLNIPIIAIVDTNCDPDPVEFPIPANDDAIKSILLIASTIADAINEGKKSRDFEQESKKAEKEKQEATGEGKKQEGGKTRPRRERKA
jgi:small subunit ribosomal protein S2